MTFEDFKSAINDWFRGRYSTEAAKLVVQAVADHQAEIAEIAINRATDEPASFRIGYSADDALKNAKFVIERKMLTRGERRFELMKADVNDPRSGGLIDDYYTDFTIDEADRLYLERFLASSDLGNRREALIALMFGVNKDNGPKFRGYAVDALVLHFLGVLEASDSQFTGDSVLAELRNRGDEEAAMILKLLQNNRAWRNR